MSPTLAEEYATIAFTPPPLPERLTLRAGEVALGQRELGTYRKTRGKMEGRLEKAIMDERYKGLAPEGRRYFLATRYALADLDARRRVIPGLARRMKGAA
jgi:hypothetical protein